MKSTAMAFAWGAALLAAIAASAAADGIIRVDFGTETSPVRKGFLRVTHKTLFGPKTAAGWVNPAGLVSKDVPVSRDWKFSESRGRKNPPPIYTTDLRRDHVEGRDVSVLRIRVPDGEYHLWILCGSGGGDRSQVWHVDVYAGAGAQMPFLRMLPDRRAVFSGPHACRVIEFKARLRAGEMPIAFSSKSRWLVNAMLLVPEAQWKRVKETEIAKLDREVFLLPEEVLKKWEHTPHEDKTPPPEPTEAEKKRGFLAYHRPYLSPIWPSSVPKRHECNPTLRAFACQGEYEPLTFALYPLRDSDCIFVDVSDLKSRDGHTIFSQDIDVRYVRYMWVRPNYSTFGTYYRAPDVLMPLGRGWRPLASGENFRVWMTVYVHAFTAPGIYKGHAAVASAPAEELRLMARVPIVFRVLPIKLHKDRSIVYGTYYRHPYDAAMRAPDALSRRWWRWKAEQEFADMAAYGLNAFVSGISGRMDAGGKWHLDFDTLGRKIDLARRHGFDKPTVCHIPTSAAYRKYFKTPMGSHLRLVKMPPKAFFDDMTELVRATEAARRRRQWPELLYYPVDEPGRSELCVRFMVEVLKAIKRVPGVRTYVTADPAHEAFAPMKPHVDVWCCQPFSLPRETILADMKQRGVEYWCYPNHIAGENDHTPVAGARMTYGFGFWRSGFRALTPWIYQAVISDPWNYLDGSAMDFFNRTDDDASPIPVMLWEAYREGIDDGRYITTLQRWIDRAREAGLTKQAKEAEAELKFVWDAIEVQEKYKYDGLWAPETFDVYRWLLARQILKLQEAVTGGRK